MKRHLMMLVALLLAVALAAPAFAAVELKYGGQFRVRGLSANNVTDGTDDNDDNQNFIDQRLRMYFYFVASENLRVVTKFEVGDTRWGNSNRLGAGGGGGVGADGVNVETKNAYVEFNIPNTPVTASVGIQGLVLLDSWIIDDDFSAAVVKAAFDPVTVQLGYIAAQNLNVSTEDNNIDSVYLAVDYAGNVGPGALTASLVGFYQYGHDTLVSFDPTTLSTPSSPTAVPAFPGFVDSNYLFDLGFKLGYKMDWMSAYLNFVKNFGTVETAIGDFDYEGWMVDAGANFFFGPYSLNVGGFYTSGDDDPADDSNKGFTYPLATSKYFSEIVGGGVFDNVAISHPNGEWRGYGFPTNLWTVTVGGAWQALEQTKVSASYWYFGTPEKVTGKGGNRESDVGHEFNLYLTQGIVDGLKLDIVGAYLLAGDAYTTAASVDDVYEVGARLQWNF